ncbi:twitching motility protein PilT [Halonotius sp. GCM10025705]|uniref:twitching motility protein PilT n=1 Tax=Halonotius sp. GCM10025705 TaxID=3252678 RepID=UPI00361AB697
MQCARKGFHRVDELFESHERVSFGDATIPAYLERTGIQFLYSFDDDFDGIEGISRL